MAEKHVSNYDLRTVAKAETCVIILPRHRHFNVFPSDIACCLRSNRFILFFWLFQQIQVAKKQLPFFSDNDRQSLRISGMG